mgnify:CR=1 FL=1
MKAKRLKIVSEILVCFSDKLLPPERAGIAKRHI